MCIVYISKISSQIWYFSCTWVSHSNSSIRPTDSGWYSLMGLIDSMFMYQFPHLLFFNVDPQYNVTICDIMCLYFNYTVILRENNLSRTIKNYVLIIQLILAINFTSFLFSLPIFLILQGMPSRIVRVQGYLHKVWKCHKKTFTDLYSFISFNT